MPKDGTVSLEIYIKGGIRMANINQITKAIQGLGKPQKKILTRYIKNLSRDKDPMVFDDAMERTLKVLVKSQSQLKAVIASLKKRHYSQSKYSYAQMEEQIQRFEERNPMNRAWNRRFQKQKAKLVTELKQRSRRRPLKTLQYTSGTDFAKVLPRLDTHAGFAWIEFGKKLKGEYLQGMYQWLQPYFANARIAGTFNLPIIFGTRTQATAPFDTEGNEVEFKDKTRMVHIVDIRVIMAELIFAKPFQILLGNTDWYAGGKDDLSINQYLRTFSKGRRHWITLDYSKFDSSIPAWLIYECFDVIKQVYDRDIYFDDALFTAVVNDFIHKVFIDGEGNLRESHKGVPSGSMFTQIIDSLANRLMIDTYMDMCGCSDYDMMIMGDDNIIFTREEVDSAALATYLAHNFGTKVNKDKSAGGKVGVNYPEFLSRRWTPFGIFRNPYELLAKLLCPERFRQYRKKGFDPFQIVDAYMQSFELGMREIIDMKKFRLMQGKKVRNVGREAYLTGLMRYRALYMSR